MSRKCDVCGKQKSFGNTVSFSHKRGNRSWSPNIRRVRAVVNGSVKRINACTKCLKSGKVQRAI